MTPLLIAELATNHCGDLDLLRRMVNEAAEAGADIVKVQAFDCRFLRPGDPQEAWLRRCELSHEHLRDFAFWCRAANVIPLATVFDAEMPAVLKKLGYDRVKVGSGDAMRGDVVEACLDNFETVYVSTGMIDTDEMNEEWGTDIFRQIVPLHCTTRYPTDSSLANLSRMHRLTLGDDPFGYSDHTEGIEACVFALAMGASVIEKHFSLPGEGRNQAWDLHPMGFAELAHWRDKWVTMRGGPEQDGERDPDAERFIGRWTA